jgi:phosphonate transport system substrate-binding protein
MKPSIAHPLLAVLVTLGLAAPAAAHAQKTYTFGVVPQVAVQKLAKQWIPVVEKVSAMSGVKLTFVTAPSMDEFYKRSVAREYDFGLENPLTYIKTENDYTPIAKPAKAKLVGLIYVTKESPLQTLCDLKGKTFAVGSHGSFVASVAPMHALQQECGLDLRRDIKILITGTQEGVFPAALGGQAQALGVNARVFAMQPQDVQARFRVLYKTREYSNLPVVARNDVPPDVVKRVQDALVALAKDPENAPLLQEIAMPSGFEAAKAAEWDDVRKFAAELNATAQALKEEAARKKK